MQPVILDFDNSVGALPDALVIPLHDWHESIRFGCSRRALQCLDNTLTSLLPKTYGPVLLGSGDFHHVSYLLIRRVNRHSRCRVVVLDNHPDNMRFPLGIHCGSWVSHVAALPNVSHVDVVGITSSDVSFSRLWENRWRPLLNGKVTYWCIGTDVRWAKRFGLGSAFQVRDSADALVEAFVHSVRDGEQIYLSIDKDVLHPDVAHTNWDQGVLQERHIADVMRRVMPRLVGVDITGDVSSHTYLTHWKRWFSAMDHQPTIPSASLEEWQRAQHAINERLLACLK